MDRQRDLGAFECYLMYYYVMFNKDKVRTTEADSMERQLGLN